jgi:hypothetical protein
MVIDVMPVQPAKADLPIISIEWGIVTKVMPVHPLKADLPIDVTE